MVHAVSEIFCFYPAKRYGRPCTYTNVTKQVYGVLTPELSDLIKPWHFCKKSLVTKITFLCARSFSCPLHFHEIMKKMRTFSTLSQFLLNELRTASVHFIKSNLKLEQRHNKNDSIQTILKLPPFFPHCIGGEKARQFQRWNYF